MAGAGRLTRPSHQQGWTKVGGVAMSLLGLRDHAAGRLLRARAIALGSAVALSAVGCGGSGTPPTLEPQTIPAATVGHYYEVKFTASGGATVTTPNLPSNGLQILTGAGHALLFGVPTAEGTVTINVTAIVGGPTMFQKPPVTERAYSLTVGPSTGDSGLIFDATSLSFTATEPLTADLNDAVHGGHAPYRFELYCLDRGDVCTDPQPTNQPPDGMTLSTDGVLSGTIGPETGTNAYPNQRRFDFVVCVNDSSSAHACATVDLKENPAPPSP
jgi:hypothetical protein